MRVHLCLPVSLLLLTSGLSASTCTDTLSNLLGNSCTVGTTTVYFTSLTSQYGPDTLDPTQVNVSVSGGPGKVTVDLTPSTEYSFSYIDEFNSGLAYELQYSISDPVTAFASFSNAINADGSNGGSAALTTTVFADSAATDPLGTVTSSGTTYSASTPAGFTDNNTGLTVTPNTVYVYDDFSITAPNPGASGGIVGMEDTFSSGSTTTSSNPPNAPEPGSWVMMAGAVGAVIVLCRRKRRTWTRI